MHVCGADTRRVEDKAAEEEKKQCDLKNLVDETYAKAVQEVESEVSEVMFFHSISVRLSFHHLHTSLAGLTVSSRRNASSHVMRVAILKDLGRMTTNPESDERFGLCRGVC